jgi:hypothetical protein
MSVLEKIFGHRHKFVFVKTLEFEPLFEGSQYAGCKYLYRCVCGEERIESRIEYY